MKTAPPFELPSDCSWCIVAYAVLGPYIDAALTMGYGTVGYEEGTIEFYDDPVDSINRMAKHQRDVNRYIDSRGIGRYHIVHIDIGGSDRRSFDYMFRGLEMFDFLEGLFGYYPPISAFD